MDACCINRLTDDQSQVRVRDEADAVESTLRMVRGGFVAWVSSEVLIIEVGRNPDTDRRGEAEALLSFADELVVPNKADADRARRIQELGFSAFDALHLACAERGNVDVFLTTDDDLLRRAHRYRGQLHVQVENPVSWYKAARL